ncbi:MAG: adenylyl-sulfate kinase [Bacteroidia bacterium]|nr:adenylyl-sulfate kinase [Bacteroidia bacterium]
MILVQLTGLSGAGKSTLAGLVSERLSLQAIRVEVLDGDVYRNSPICKGLGFSLEDRKTNLERLFHIGTILLRHDVVVIIAAINPFEELRLKFAAFSERVKTVWINCDMDTLVKRDTKGFYKRAILSDENKEKVSNFTGISSPYENPAHPDLVIDTSLQSVQESVDKLYKFILTEINKLK